MDIRGIFMNMFFAMISNLGLIQIFLPILVAYQVKAGSSSYIGLPATYGIMLTISLMVILSSLSIPKLTLQEYMIRKTNYNYIQLQNIKEIR